jgi:site-specific DNA-methyltransferase (adenine-specific)
LKPYFETDLGVLYHGDCLEIMPQLPKVDLVLTDPPYGIGYDASHKKYKNGVSRDNAEWDVNPFDPSPIVALKAPSIIWGGNCFSSRLPDFSGWLCWVKTARNGAKVRQADMELAWTNCIRRPRVFRHLWIGAYRESESGIRNVHPTQKPVAVMLWCLSLHNGGLVFDPFLGSGTTAVACERLGRRWIGIELEEKYCEIAARRIEDEAAQLKLFA